MLLHHLYVTYEEWNKSLLAILGDGRGQRIASHTELVVALDVTQFDQTDQSGFLYWAVSLSTSNNTRAAVSFIYKKKSSSALF